jgi:cytochrome c-type biogenesis protein CcmH/NrfG
MRLLNHKKIEIADLRKFGLLRGMMGVVALLCSVQSHGQAPIERITIGNDLLRDQRPAEALVQFQQALVQQSDNKDALRRAGKAQEWLGRWSEAIQIFQRLAALDSGDVESWYALGRIHGWAGHTAESISSFEKALVLAPDRADIGTGYADVLSWNPHTRKEAITRYERVLNKDPQNIPARVGLAQARAWSGSIGEAQSGYSDVLAEDPSNITALLGLAEIARWRMQLLEANRLLTQVAAVAPSDLRVRKAAAEIDLSMSHYDSARKNAQMLAATDATWAKGIERRIDLVRRPSFEVGFNLRRDQQVAAPNRLDYNAYSTALALPLRAQGHLTLLSTIPLYRGDGPVPSTHYTGVRWESIPNYRVRFALEALAEVMADRPKDMSATARVEVVASDWVQMKFAIDRHLVGDSLQSVRGTQLNNELTGLVHSNLASWQNTFKLAPAELDIYANLVGGFYDGHCLDRNWMGQIDSGLGKLLRNNQPSVRVGYGFTAIRFVQDQSFLPADGGPSNRTGGYFSPRLFLNNFAVLGLSGKFASTGEWKIDSALGLQQVRDRFADLDTRKLSSTAHASLWVPLNERLRLGFSYDFLNVGNSFRRNYFSSILRITF